MLGLSALQWWTTRRWLAAIGGAVVTALALGLPTDVIPNPVFGRQGTPVTWWSYPVLALTAALSGLLFATYVNNSPINQTAASKNAASDDASLAGGIEADHRDQIDQSGRLGGVGGLLSFFAIGCPICNKVVLLALGAAGAVKWFAPVQPFLGIVSLVLVAWALVLRLRGELACPVSPRPVTEPDIADTAPRSAQSSLADSGAASSSAAQPSAAEPSGV